MGGLDKSKVLDISRLSQPGKKDQEVVMVQNGATTEAHQWNESSKSWIKLGEVVDAIGSNRKQLFDGREYDFVFDVDIREGAPPLKLPYNVVDNPYQAAQEFLTRNELPQDYLDQVANFIIKNTGGVPLGMGPSVLEAGGDPFTGSGRYVPGSAPALSSVPFSGANADPFTGSGSTSAPVTPSRLLPLGRDAFLFFRPANLPALQQKIAEFNSQTAENARLSSEQLSGLDMLASLLKSNTKVKFNDYQPLIQTLLSWPPEKQFPALDLLRLISLSVDDFNAELVLDQFKSSSQSPVNIALLLKTLSNLFHSRKDLILNKRRTMIDAIIGRWKGLGGKNVTLPYVTVLLNLSIELYWNIDDDEMALEIIGDLMELLKSEIDEETIFRSLATIGNLIQKYGELREALTLMEWGKIRDTMIAKGGRLEAITKEINL